MSSLSSSSRLVRWSVVTVVAVVAVIGLDVSEMAEGRSKDGGDLNSGSFGFSGILVSSFVPNLKFLSSADSGTASCSRTGLSP